MKLWRMVVGRYRMDGVVGIGKAIFARLRNLSSRVTAKVRTR